MLNIPCIIFAGGKSSRMGEDKSLLPFGNSKTLTQFQLKKLQKIFNNVYISCKNKNKFDFEANFIEDIPSENIFAPTTGFIATFEKLNCERFFALSVDTPFISSYEIKKLVKEDIAHANITIARTKSGIQPMCGIYHNSIKDKFIQMFEENNHKLGFLIKNSNTTYVDFKDEKAFLNLNNPKEYQEALTLI